MLNISSMNTYIKKMMKIDILAYINRTKIQTLMALTFVGFWFVLFVVYLTIYIPFTLMMALPLVFKLLFVSLMLFVVYLKLVVVRPDKNSKGKGTRC